MKSLVIFYSRTGNTKKVAENIANDLNCDIEEIFDTKNRAGSIGWLSAGKDANTKKLTTLKEWLRYCKTQVKEEVTNVDN